MTSRQTRKVVRAAVQNVVEQLEARQLLSLTIDLRLPGGAGKIAEVSAEGQVIDMELWAVVTGGNSASDDEGLQTVVGALKSFRGGGVLGNLSVKRLDPFVANASANGARIDLDGDGDLDVGRLLRPRDPLLTHAHLD